MPAPSLLSSITSTPRARSPDDTVGNAASYEELRPRRAPFVVPSRIALRLHWLYIMLNGASTVMDFCTLVVIRVRPGRPALGGHVSGAPSTQDHP
jgi:hypothetical protein